MAKRTNMTTRAANAILNQASGGKVQIGSSSTGFDNLPNVLVKMIVQSTFKRTLGDYWTNFFGDLASRTDVVGALNKIVDAGELEIDDDTITVATDLLPDLSRTSGEYAKTFEMDVKKRVELILSMEEYKLAFTTLDSFNNFITLLKSKVGVAVYIYMWQYVQSTIIASIKNTVDLGDIKDQVVFQKLIYRDLAVYTPWSTEFNLGAVHGTPTIPAGTINTLGADFQVPTKQNTLNFETSKMGTKKYTGLNAFMPAVAFENQADLLSTVYHDNTQNVVNRIGDIIDLTQASITLLKVKFLEHNDYMMIVLDKDSLFISTRLETHKAQPWVKGPGGGIMQMVFSFWKTVALIPWANGIIYHGKQEVPPTDTTPDQAV